MKQNQKNRIKHQQQNKQGFTLLEIMIVLVLLGLVASMVLKQINPDKGKIQAAKIQVKQLEASLDRFKLDCNFYPTTEQGGLKALIEKPTGGRACPSYDPDGYMDSKKKSVPKDPWGEEYKYECTDGQNYVIKSLGPDALEGGEGKNADISSADEN
jgi:general secretion pathway protein G